ncbi:50S ribosomal protein L25 [bacterium]|nr:MAG: 50S ribosomal protein L25 [bacterium]
MYKIKAEIREEKGKTKVKKLRKEGWIPGVVYGHGEKTMNIKVREEELKKLVHSIPSESTVIELHVGKKKFNTLFQEITRDIFTDRFLHVDFHILHKGEKVWVKVPIELTGECKGVKEGGIIDFIVREVEVECLPKDIPEKIVVDITNLGIGDSLHVGDIDTGGKFTIDMDPHTPIVSIIMPKKMEAAVAAEEVEEVVEEAPEEPEVIAKGKEEEEKEE